MSTTVWQHCLNQLKRELTEKDLNMWIHPLQYEVNNGVLRLMAPNTIVQSQVISNYKSLILKALESIDGVNEVDVVVGSQAHHQGEQKIQQSHRPIPIEEPAHLPSNLDSNYTFDNFVECKSNDLAKASATQVADNPGHAFNPLLIYGGSGLGKTHLMHAVGNEILKRNPQAKVAYLHSERFVGDMVNAIRNKMVDEFKRLYRSVDILLVDDIQFFANKPRSQEEFFHTFNAMMEKKHQIILTCDRYPKEVDGLENRLKSRFSWGLPVPVEPPELEDRVAILQSKAEEACVDVPNEVAFFIAKRVRSNVRDLEGAMRRVIANSQFTGKAITLDFAKDALRDLIASQEKMISIDNIQKTVCDYYNIKINELKSSSRKRSITRPRQIAMTLAKKLTNHSLPEIGEAFGGRDHTTVIHATRQVKKLRQEDDKIQDDYKNLMRILSS